MTEWLDPRGTNDLVLPLIADPDDPVADFADRPEEGGAGQGVDDGEDDAEASWILMPMPPSVMTDLVWHYTDPHGAVGIFRSRELWATSMASLNDSAEFAHGLEILNALAGEVAASRNIHPIQKSHIAEVIAQVNSTLETSQLYVFCATEEADSLSQWRAYGADGVGYAIAFDPKSNLAVLDEAAPSRGLPEAAPWPAWGRVLYQPSEQRAMLLRGITFCALTAPHPDHYEKDDSHSALWLRHGVGVMTGLLAFCKHPAFADEREVRVVTTAPLESVRFRPSRLGIAPYVRLVFVDDDAGKYETMRWTMQVPGHLPVRAARVGPTAHAEPATHGMKMLLAQLRIGGVEVLRSVTPYR